MKPYGNNHVQFGEGKYPSTRGGNKLGCHKSKSRRSSVKVRRQKDKLEDLAE